VHNLPKGDTFCSSFIVFAESADTSTQFLTSFKAILIFVNKSTYYNVLSVFCKGTTVAASGKAGYSELNVPISCGGAMIHPGDIIVGDADGVVVIPQAMEQEILVKSLDKLEADRIREEKVSGNKEEIIKYLNDMLSR
jgi:hypothetical protein